MCVATGGPGRKAPLRLEVRAAGDTDEGPQRIVVPCAATMVQFYFVIAFAALWAMLAVFLRSLHHVVRIVDRNDPEGPRDYGL